MINVRLERPEDIPHVRIVNKKAFGQHMETDLVEKLRYACPDVLSLVAEEVGCIVGHIMSTSVMIDYQGAKVEGMGLAPMAVHPSHQRQGIGSKLVRKGLEILENRECPFVIVLDYQEYYPRFGFEPASKYNIESQWEGIPDEAFLISVFDKNVLRNVKGIARYRDEFNEGM